MKTLLPLVVLLLIQAYAPAQSYIAHLDSAQENNAADHSLATGTGTFILTDHSLAFHIAYSGLMGTPTAAHIHKAAFGVNGPVILPFASPNSPIDGTFTLTDAQISDLNNSLFYANVHSTVFPGGEIRGQIEPVMVPEPSSLALAGLGLGVLVWRLRRR